MKWFKRKKSSIEKTASSCPPPPRYIEPEPSEQARIILNDINKNPDLWLVEEGFGGPDSVYNGSVIIFRRPTNTCVLELGVKCYDYKGPTSLLKNYAIPEHDKAGERLIVLALCDLMSERKKAKAAKLEAEERARAKVVLDELRAR